VSAIYSQPSLADKKTVATHNLIGGKTADQVVDLRRQTPQIGDNGRLVLLSGDGSNRVYVRDRLFCIADFEILVYDGCLRL